MQLTILSLIFALNFYSSLAFTQEEVEFDLHVFTDIYDNNELTSNHHREFTRYIREAKGELSFCPYDPNYLIANSPNLEQILKKRNNPFFEERKHLFSYCVFTTKRNSNFNAYNHYHQISPRYLDNSSEASPYKETAVTILWGANSLRGYSLEREAPPLCVHSMSPLFYCPPKVFSK